MQEGDWWKFTRFACTLAWVKSAKLIVVCIGTGTLFVLASPFLDRKSILRVSS